MAIYRRDVLVLCQGSQEQMKLGHDHWSVRTGSELVMGDYGLGHTRRHFWVAMDANFWPLRMCKIAWFINYILIPSLCCRSPDDLTIHLTAELCLVLHFRPNLFGPNTRKFCKTIFHFPSLGIDCSLYSLALNVEKLKSLKEFIPEMIFSAMLVLRWTFLIS